MKVKLKTAIHASACKIELSQGLCALIDAEDYERISRHKWYALKDRSGNFYARRIRKKTDPPGSSKVFMHRELLNVPAGMQTHHKNHKTLDNRKCNIEAVTAAENIHACLKTKKPTTSRYKGVRKHFPDYADGGERWEARISCDGIQYEIGTFRDEVSAAREYDRASREHHGRFSEPNFKEFVRRENIEGRLEEARGRFFLMYVKQDLGKPGTKYSWLVCQYSKGEAEKHVHLRGDEDNIIVRDIRRDPDSIGVLVAREKVLALQIARRNVLVV